MSPRRRLPTDPPPPPAAAGPADREPDRGGRLRVVFAGVTAALVIVATLTVATVMLIEHEKQRRTALREVAVLDVARSFTVQVMSPDPTGDYGANRYVDRMTAQVTGELETYWREARDRILIEVAKGPQSEATVLYAGLERWHDDGSADVLVIAKQSIKDDDGNTIAEPIAQVLETVRQEGDQWKISNMGPVI